VRKKESGIKSNSKKTPSTRATSVKMDLSEEEWGMKAFWNAMSAIATLVVLSIQGKSIKQPWQQSRVTLNLIAMN